VYTQVAQSPATAGRGAAAVRKKCLERNEHLPLIDWYEGRPYEVSGTVLGGIGGRYRF
jgi:hypothetical protein